MRKEQQISRLGEVLLNNRNTDIFISIYNNKNIVLAHGYGIDLYDILGNIFINCNVKTINKKINCLEIELDSIMLLMNMRGNK